MSGLTRLAPTPSGFLHAGNIMNFELTAELARAESLQLALRIDDSDAGRYRREYVDDIFDTLQRLGIEWQVGPQDPADFEAHWSQQLRTEYYRAEVARAQGLDTYACTCSRSVVTSTPTGGCPGGCRRADLPLSPGISALRLHVPIGTCVEVSGHVIDLAEAMGDFVVWRRDDLPSYQIVSVIEDRDLGTTHIVRGEDLLASSAAQIHIAQALRADNVARATFIHHPLVRDADGHKLSKSQRGGRAAEQ